MTRDSSSLLLPPECYPQGLLWGCRKQQETAIAPKGALPPGSPPAKHRSMLGTQPGEAEPKDVVRALGVTGRKHPALKKKKERKHPALRPVSLCSTQHTSQFKNHYYPLQICHINTSTEASLQLKIIFSSCSFVLKSLLRTIMN